MSPNVTPLTLLTGLLLVIIVATTDRLQVLTALRTDLAAATGPQQRWHTAAAITPAALATLPHHRAYLPGITAAPLYSLDFSRTERLLKPLDHLPASLNRVRELASTLPAASHKTEQQRFNWLLQEHMASLPAQHALADVVARYRRYQAALSKAQASTANVNTKELRDQYFTAAQIAHLFAAEDARHDYLWQRRKVLERRDLSPQEKAEALERLRR